MTLPLTVAVALLPDISVVELDLLFVNAVSFNMNSRFDPTGRGPWETRQIGRCITVFAPTRWRLVDGCLAAYFSGNHYTDTCLVVRANLLLSTSNVRGKEAIY